ncbi:hypothetical protein DRN74_05245 [Candidatus Micrarchaeota archaeon]|nr:MAG: hypothetical protein DRN74_05245 [Candidatus Micrarchaeota archaeon]
MTLEEYERLLEEVRKGHPRAEVALAFDDDFLKRPSKSVKSNSARTELADSDKEVLDDPV